MKIQRIWNMFCVLILPLFNTIPVGGQTTLNHVIISYDNSGSMAEKYLGAGMHQIVQQTLMHMLYGSGTDLELPKEAGHDGIWAEEFAQPTFPGFPLLRENSVVSAFHFGTQVIILQKRGTCAQNVITSYFPKTFTDQHTEIKEALRTAAWELLDAEKDQTVLWILISDGLDDPMDPSNQVGFDFTKRDLRLLYNLVLHAPLSLVNKWHGLWLQKDTQLINAFGDSCPPNSMLIRIYEIRDTNWPTAPQGLAYSVVNSRDTESTLEVVFYPGEWNKDKHGIGPGRIDRERAQSYRIELSVDRKTWITVSDVTCQGIFPYKELLEPINNGNKFLRVSAIQNNRVSQISYEIPIVLIPVIVNADSPRVAGNNTRLIWNQPHDPAIKIKIEKSTDKGVSWKIIAILPSDQGMLDTDELHSGDWVQFTAITDVGSGPPRIVKPSEEIVTPNWIPEFDATPKEGFAPLTVRFNDRTSTATGRQISNWNWEFGDGTFGSDQNSTHQYKVEGIYTVALSVTIGDETHRVVRENLICITSGVDYEGSGVILGILMIVVLLASIGLLIWFLLPHRVSFSLEVSGGHNEVEVPIRMLATLDHKERVEFSEPDEDESKVIAWWPELNAPNDYLVNRWHSIYHVRINDADDSEENADCSLEEVIQDGQEFTILQKDRREVRLLFHKEEKMHNKIDKEGETSVTSSEGDMTI